jgi:PAS domain S-box-containing protein
MTDAASHLAFLHDPRLAALATSATPAWLWSTDASRILWSNPVGAAIFGAATPGALTARHFDAKEQSAVQVARLLGTLRLDGAARLERLRGFGTGLWRALLCSCSRVTLADQTAGVLVVAMEPAGPALTLAERVRRLYDGSGRATAAFAPDGNLLDATPEARTRLGDSASLAALGAERLGEHAISLGRTSGEVSGNRVTVERLGAEAATVLMMTFADVAAAPIPAPAQEPEPVAPPHAPPVTPLPAVAAEPPNLPTTPPPQEIVAPPTVPAEPETPEAPPVAPEMPDPAAAQPAPVPPPTPAPPAQDEAGEAVVEPPVAPEPPPLRIDVPMAERRHPLRFVWQMDANGRFTLGSDEFTEVIGPRVAIALGRPWDDVNHELALDPEGQVARAVATHDTWSGITVSWPVDGIAERLKVELSGLPIYDRNRTFLGYRGFGVCRDVDRIATLAVMRRSGHAAAPASADTQETTADGAPTPAPDATQARAAATRPATANVVPFRSPAPPPEPKAPALSPVERNAFHELARQLTARLKGDGGADAGAPQALAEAAAAPAPAAESAAAPAPAVEAAAAPAPTPEAAAIVEPAQNEPTERALLDRIPVGVLVYRLDTLLYANRAFLEWTGYDHLDAIAEAGGLDSLFVEGGAESTDDGSKTLAIATPRGDKLPVEGRLLSVPWEGETALVLMLATNGAEERLKAADDRLKASDEQLKHAGDRLSAAETAVRLAEARAREHKTALDTATDGVVVFEPDGRIVSANHSAEALFGYEAAELTTRSFADLFVPDSRAAALGYLASLGHGGVGSLIAQGREFTGQVRQGSPLALFMTLGRIADDSTRVCAVFRDISAQKKQESELVAARTEAERASAAKSDFLAKVSHEIRTPLNSILGFSEVMLEERFGPIGNERYRDYLKDIRASGDHLVALLNDLLDLSKIEAGRLDLAPASLNLNEVVQSCVALMQPQANRERIIIRTSLSPTLPPVTADARSLRQIALTLLSNSIKFTGAGGQVIVSTARSATGEIALRVRDTGIGMDEKELGVALEPFRQLATANRWGSDGTGLGLPLTKALAEANGARFTITSKVNDGTLVEVAFPAAHAAAK